MGFAADKKEYMENINPTQAIGGAYKYAVW